ncbi:MULTISPECIES: right-handed parallel beta-helix repeat-containing protein [unclassified Beijerinckia]|uniref:right-handed parallel beta-helix repeat-containing protein n=1 Tax=unclassified Beijerinckia TaxID=2638183 RepID=UPI001114FC33|nr:MULTISPECIES: right-handed parallel beta-helix repeat-containing protein [unclassified Beijerinckia]
MVASSVKAELAVNIIGRTTFYPEDFGSGKDHDQINRCIAAASQEAIRSGGADVVLSRRYRTEQPIEISASRVNLVAKAGATIAGIGRFDTIRFRGSAKNEIYYNHISGLALSEYEKTGGRSIAILYAAQFIADDIPIENPYLGYDVISCNNVTLRNIRVANPRGEFGGRLTGGGQAKDGMEVDGRSDVIALENVVHSGGSARHRVDGNRHGLVVDGFVHTVSAKKLYFTAIDGHGLWVRNSVGAKDVPSFFSLYGVEGDFCYGVGVLMDQCNQFFMTDPMIHGSKGGPNIRLGEAVSGASLQGGFSTGARGDGIEVAAKDVAIIGMKIADNSAPPQGGKVGAASGIILKAANVGSRIVGNRVGSPSHPDWQKHGIEIEEGASSFVVTSNVTTGNARHGIANFAGTDATKIVTNNI